MSSDDIGKIFLLPKTGTIMAFKNKPPVETFNSFIKLFRNQYVLVVDCINISDDGTKNFFYQVLAKEGLIWVHYFDLIKINQKTGKPEINIREQ